MMNGQIRLQMNEINKDLKKWNHDYYDCLPSDVMKIWKKYYTLCRQINEIVEEDTAKKKLLDDCFYSILKEKDAIKLLCVLLDLSESEIESRIRNHTFTQEEIGLFINAWRKE